MNKKIKIKKETPVWLGAQRLMSRTEPHTKEDNERKLILLTAKVIGISPFGVNILGSLPYINKLGLTQKAFQYNENLGFEYSWDKLSVDDGDKAICKCRIKDKKENIELTDWVLGECSPSSMKMSTLKGYQNHIAQTRAKNRAILELYGVKIHEEMMSKIYELLSRKETTPAEKTIIEKIGNPVASSVEEINETKETKEIGKKTSGCLFDIEEEIDELKALAIENGAVKGKEREYIEKKIKHPVNFYNATPNYISIIKAQFLNSVVKQ